MERRRKVALFSCLVGLSLLGILGTNFNWRSAVHLIRQQHTDTTNIRVIDIETSTPENTAVPPVNPKEPYTTKDSYLHTILFNKRPFNHSHIVYIKTHKAASSTTQSILMRYGMRNRLTFAIAPRTSKRNQLGWPAKFNHKVHISNEVTQPDILCHHSVLSTDLIDTMPKDSFYLTTMRDPFTQIISSYNYYGVGVASKQSLMALLDTNVSRKNGAVLKNPQMFDSGMSVNLMKTDKDIMDRLKALDVLFHFVIIVEYFEECLILLRDMMKWTNDDILYVKVNFKGNKSASSQPKPDPMVPADTPENRKAVYEHLRADYIVYNFFKLKVEKIIKQNRQYLDAEIAKLHDIQSTWTNFCIKDSRISSQIKDRRFRTYGRGSYGYILTEQGYNNQTCIELACAEIYHSELLRKYQADLLGLKL